jgi:hypothetical protein
MNPLFDTRHHDCTSMPVIIAHKVSYSHRQMSMPKPVCPNMATATAPGRRGPGGAEAARRVAQAGRATIRRTIRRPEGAARKVSASVRRACIPGHLRGIGPEPGTWKDPDPRRSSRDQEARNRAACPVLAATRYLRASGHEKMRVCGQLAPGLRPSEFQFRGHLRSRWLVLFSAGVRRVVMLVVPPVWMGLR